jgi:hypothetical protein
MAEPKGQGKDRDRPTDPELQCLALTREDFGRLVEAVGDGHDEGPKRSDPGGRGRYAAVLAGPPFRGFYELGQPNGSRHRTMAAPAACHKLQQPCTRARQSALDEFRQWQGAVAPIFTQPRRGRFSASVCQRSASVPQRPASSDRVSANAPHTLRASSTSFTRGGVGALHGRHVGGQRRKRFHRGNGSDRSIRRRPNRRGKRATYKTPASTRTEGV